MTNTISWRALAACADPKVDPEVMFPENSNLRGARTARNICRGCPVALQCLLTVMAEEGASKDSRFGVRAGTNRLQRQYLYDQVREGRITLREGAERLIARVLARPRTLREMFEERVTPEADGHMAWRLQKMQTTYQGRTFSPMQLAFTVGHGRFPEGRVRAACGRTGCVAWQHLTDDLMRRQQTYADATPAA
ncbi:WhiB family transcriptional regulator [Streptomyces sp. NPDC056543]|uniref:WhiB family transcriptional regulator n=1 Tax=unclassified Streptomyces TaxID=2593676 RepID=UPI0036B5A96D